MVTWLISLGKKIRERKNTEDKIILSIANSYIVRKRRDKIQNSGAKFVSRKLAWSVQRIADSEEK